MSKISFYREKNFKKTEIGEIPREWEVRKLGDIAHLEGGQSAPQGEIYFKNGKYPFIRVQHISNNHKIIGYDLISEQAIKDYHLKLYPKGAIIFPKSGASIFQEKRAILPFDSYVVSHLCVVIPKEVDNLFLYYSLIRKKFSININDNYPSLRISDLKKVLILIPPLEEQKNIAKVLKDFDDLLENIEKQIKTLERVKKGLMNIYFTKGVFKHETFKDTEIGRIPAEWEVRRLGGDICEINPKYKVQKGKFYKFLPMEAVSEGHYKVKFVETRAWKGSGVKYSHGDILLARITPSAENGKTAIVDFLKENEIGTGSTEFIVFKPKNADSFYIYYLIKWDKVRNQLISQMSGTTGRQRIPNDAPHKVKVPLPKIQEQKAIAERLKTIDDQIENLKKQKEHLQKVKKKFMELLLTGKVRVKTQ